MRRHTPLVLVPLLLASGCASNQRVHVEADWCEPAGPFPLPGVWPLASDGSLSGVVHDEHGAPVPAVVVRLVRLDGEPVERLTMSGGDGTFTLLRVEAGRFIASAGRIGYRTAADTVQTSSASGEPVRLTIAQQRIC